MSKASLKISRSHFPPEASEDPAVKVMKRDPKTIAPGLCDLPSEVLAKIFGYINVRQHSRLRGTSKRLRDVSDMLMMHEFRRALYGHTNSPTSCESTVLKIIEFATEVYVRAGLGSIFCGCILPMLRRSYEKPFCHHIRKIEEFLVLFYKMVDELLGSRSSQRSCMLYSLTLMRFLTKFHKSIISLPKMSLCWRVTLELEGLWLTKTWTSNMRSRCHPAKDSNILTIFSKMLMAKITGEVFVVFESQNEIYIFGKDTRFTKRIPKTYFTITVHGSDKICSLFRSSLEDPSDQFTWPSEWPEDQFSFTVDIICELAPHWGFSETQHMEFGPFTELQVIRNEVTF